MSKIKKVFLLLFIFFLVSTTAFSRPLSSNNGVYSSGLGLFGISTSGPCPSSYSTTAGKTLFITNYSPETIRPYSFNTAYDLSSFSSDGDTTTFPPHEALGAVFDNQGDKIFIVKGSNLRSYELPNPYDVCELNNETSKDMGGTIEGVQWNDDGSKIYLIKQGNRNFVESYSTTSNFTINDLTQENTFELSDGLDQSTDGSSRDIAFNKDGTKAYEIGADDDFVYTYSLSTAFDFSTASSDGSWDTQEIIPRKINFNQNGSKMFILENNDKVVIEYELSTAFDVSTASEVDRFSFNESEAMEFLWTNEPHY